LGKVALNVRGTDLQADDAAVLAPKILLCLRDHDGISFPDGFSLPGGLSLRWAE
jgi:hypothetical protein